jgi:hypothetical protein
VIRRSGTARSRLSHGIAATLAAALALAWTAAAADPAIATRVTAIQIGHPAASFGGPDHTASGPDRTANSHAANNHRTGADMTRLSASDPVSWQLRLVTQHLPLTDHSQYVVVIAGTSDAWFFGGSNLAGRGVPEVVHRAGGHWQFPDLPAGLHGWIAAASSQSPTNIWAVTYLGGTILRWDGSTWQTQAPGAWSASVQFTGINAIAADSVWLFGARGLAHPGGGTWHWDGANWSRVTGIAGGIRRASAVSATDMWAIGGIGGSLNALLQFNGTIWRHVTPVALTGFRYAFVLALARANVWVAGSVAGTPKLAHYDGHGWTLLAMPGSVAAAGVCRDGRGGLWVITNSGAGTSVLRERSAAGRWTIAPIDSGSASQMLACAWIPGTGAAWGAGKTAAPTGTAATVYSTGNPP